ncbi:MAG: DNA-3-methyladenine glycosylase [Chitinophagaceae bacterium]|nr:DNA-3-methyladenine glycosylase [Chitinophagaceae bacterium]
MEQLPLEFYTRNDVLQIARELLGKLLVTNLDRKTTSGRIVEVEAYNGIVDKASHAFGNRRTNRTETMYAEGGVAYVYLCYGIHHLFNVVTNKNNNPHAILIRALEPVTGIETMLKRTGKKKLDFSLTRGPGNLSKALGLSTLQNGFKLTDKAIYIADDGIAFTKREIMSSPRIGVEYAGEDALLPYRFYKKENPYVSGKPK